MRLFNKTFQTSGTRSAADVESDYNRANAASKRLVQGFRERYLAALQLGVSSEGASKVLRGAGVSRDDVAQVKSGFYMPLTASKEAQRNAGPERTKIYNDLYRAQEPRQWFGEQP